VEVAVAQIEVVAVAQVVIEHPQEQVVVEHRQKLL
jgi:hypothetical protein